MNWFTKISCRDALNKAIKDRGWSLEQVRMDGVEIYQNGQQFFVSLGDWSQIDGETVASAVKEVFEGAEVEWDFEAGPGKGNWEKIL